MNRTVLTAMLACAAFVAEAQELTVADRAAFADGLYARGMLDQARKEYESLLKDKAAIPDADAAHFRLGECYRQLGDISAADREFRFVFVNCPDSRFRFRAGFRRAELYGNARRHAEAADLFKELLDAKPPADIAAAASCLRGLSLLETGKRDEAEQCFERSVREAPDGEFAPFALLKLGEVFSGGAAGAAPERQNKAVEFLRRAAEARGNDRVAAEALFQLAGLLFRRKEFAASADAYAALSSRFPSDTRVPEARIQMAWAAHNAGLYARGIEIASAAAAEAGDPRRAEWLYLKANCERQLMRSDDAISSYRELISKYPAAETAGASRHELALTLVRKGLYREALDTLEGMQVPEELRKDVCWLRAEASSGAGDEDRAVQYYRMIARDFPDSDVAPHSIYRIGHYLQARKEYHEAAKLYHQVFDKYPASGLADKALFAAAACYSESGREQEAVAEWALLIERYAGSPYAEESLYRRGMGEIKLQRMAQAGLSFGSLLERFPGTGFAADASFWLGIIAARDGKAAEAEARFRRALDLKPEASIREQAAFRLGLVLRQGGKSAEAAATLFPLLETCKELRSDPALLGWLSSELWAGKRGADAAAVARALCETSSDPSWRQAGFALLGRALQETDPAGAAKAFESALAEKASTEYAPEAALRAGEFALKSGDPDRAGAYLKRAGEMATDDRFLGIRARAYAGLGTVAAAKGRDEDAARYFLIVGVLYDDPAVVPASLLGAAEAYGRLQKPDERARVLKELAERYPESQEARSMKETP